jgi:hypothetical protein
MPPIFWILGVSAADRDHKMDFAGFLESVTKFQSAGISIDNDRDGWAQPISITQACFHARIKPVQIIDHLPDGLTFHGKTPLTVREMAQ